MGLPAEKAQYIHRVGRTARAGKAGRGVLLLSDFEAPYFLGQLRDVNIAAAPPLPQAAVPALQAGASPPAAQPIYPYSTTARALVLPWSRERVFAAADCIQRLGIGALYICCMLCLCVRPVHGTPPC